MHIITIVRNTLGLALIVMVELLMPSGVRAGEHSKVLDSSKTPRKAADRGQASVLVQSTDCYGDPLPPKALARLGTIRLRHAGTATMGGVESTLFSRDGKAIFTAGAGNPIRLWDLATGKLLRQFGDRQRHDASTIVLSPDGNTLATKGPNGRLALWDIGTGKLLRQWGGGITAIAFSTDGKTLTSAGQDNHIRVWEVATGKELRAQPLAAGVTVHAFSPDGKTMVSVSGNKIVQLWEIGTGKRLNQLPPGKGGLLSASFVAFSPDSRLLATGSATPLFSESSDGAVHLWDVATGKGLRQITSDKSGTYSVAFSPDGKLLATGSGFGPIRLWEVATGKELRCLQNDQAHIVSLAFSDDGTMLASGSNSVSHTVHVWEVATGKELRFSLGGHEGAVLSVAFTPNGKSIVSGGRDGTVGLWDAVTGQERCELWRGGDLQSPAALSPDGKTIASMGNTFVPDEHNNVLLSALASPTTVRLSDTSSGKAQRQFPGSPGCTQSIAISPDGKSLASISFRWVSGTLTWEAHIWDIATGKKLHRLGHGTATCGAFSSDGKVFAMGANNGIVSLWDVATGKELCHCQGHTNGIGCLAFSPDGQTLATAGNTLILGVNRPAIRLWRCVPGKRWTLEEGLVLSGHRGQIHTLAFAPNGRTLASAAQDRTLRLWETASGKERQRFQGHNGDVWCLAFAANNYRLASGSNDTTILVWDITGRLKEGRLRPTHLSAKEMERMWADLSRNDAKRAGQVIWALAADPEQTISFLKKQLRPIKVDKAVRQRINGLIKDLDDGKFQVRQIAVSELEKLGEAAEPALREALEAPNSLETKRRLKYLLAALTKKLGSDTSDGCRRLRALEVLEQSATPEARRLLETLAQGEPKAQWTQEVQIVLKRLNRLTD